MGQRLITLLVGHGRRAKNFLGSLLVEEVYSHTQGVKEHVMEASQSALAQSVASAWNVVPDLAIGIVSSTNLAEEIDRKITGYFQSGVRLVWVL